jgi:hypothetical protein
MDCTSLRQMPARRFQLDSSWFEARQFRAPDGRWPAIMRRVGIEKGMQPVAVMRHRWQTFNFLGLHRFHSFTGVKAGRPKGGLRLQLNDSRMFA